MNFPNHAFISPPAGETVTVNGRKYVGVAGTILTAPDCDRPTLEANGFILIAGGGAGTTAQRPVNPPVPTEYHDTTVGKNIIWDGKNWRDPDNASVA
jgi:hypothetical protein